MTGQLHKLGKLGYRDTGAVPGSTTYTTVVIVHGFGWSGGVFSRVEPYVAKHNTRLVLVNRRDFPVSDRYTDEERAVLAAAQSAPDGQAMLRSFMTDRGRELYDFLAEFVAQENIPTPQGVNGGLTLVTWSFGGTLMAAFLANLAKYPVNDVDLRAYMRRTILYDAPCHSLGYALPADKYHPLNDEEIPPPERPMAFSKWVTGYYTHGDSPDELERRKHVDDPRPTILNMTLEDIQTNFVQEPTAVGGSDLMLLEGGIGTGLNEVMRKSAFYLTEPDEDEGDNWADVELRYLWCDRSVYEMPWGTWALRNELEEAKQQGRRMRNITMARLSGANHFAHWDEPERLLYALLAEDIEGL